VDTYALPPSRVYNYWEGSKMNLSLQVTDNIGELLCKVLKFTKLRQKVISSNINNMDTPGYIPKDLPVEEFSDIMNEALNEHLCNNRLILVDTDTIKFKTNGNFEVTAVEDSQAAELLRINRDKYLETQINKLLENTLNRKLANQLLTQKRQTNLAE
jgi:flagellar basal-body rod protein FlgB